MVTRSYLAVLAFSGGGIQAVLRCHCQGDGCRYAFPPGSVAMTCGECFTSGASENYVEFSRVQPAGLAFFIHAPVPPYIAREILLPFTCGGVGHLISTWRSLYSTCRPSSAPGGGSKCEGPMCGAQMAPIARALSDGAQGAGPPSSGKRRSGTGRQNGPHCRRP